MQLKLYWYQYSVLAISIALTGALQAEETKAGPRAAGDVVQRVVDDVGETDGLLGWLTDGPVRLRRTFFIPGEGDSANFSFSDNLQDEANGVFQADFFLALPLPGFGGDNLYLDPEASIEGHLNSETEDRQDSWIFRLSGELDTGPIGFLDSTYTTISLKNESDRGFDTHRLSGEIIFTPTVSAMGIGRYKVLPSLKSMDPSYDHNGVLFRWRPYFGIDAGGVVWGDSNVEEDSTVRLFHRTYAEVQLDFLEPILGVNEVALFSDYKLNYLVQQARTHHSFEAGANIMFTENLGLSVLYGYGEAPPSYEETETFSVALSVKF